ncbi:DUF2993 domain-containing protein [Frankia sp. R43]|uniref:LmeA family phospholipid-binding protein n=1 Tax=Frankia sp. R43 TaxID=269536 RepID=UPI0006C9F905
MVALFPIADRFAVALTRKQIAELLESGVADALDCGAPPPTVTDIDIDGFPFLTQVLLGNFKGISLAIEGLSTPGPRIAVLDLSADGLRIPIRSIVTGGEAKISIDSVRARVEILYSDLNEYLAG